MIDANLLVYATDAHSHVHARARTWLDEQLAGPRRVGLPWLSLAAWLRIVTSPRIVAQPLRSDEAWEQVDRWLAAETAFVPSPGPRHAEVLGDLVVRHDVRGALVTDAQLAALAIEHGLVVCSADSDFARFPEVRWENPLLPRR